MKNEEENKIVNNTIEKKDNLQTIAEEFGKTRSDIQVVLTQLLKGGTTDELRYFLNVAKVHDLNPFTKEISAYKDYKGNLIIIVTREGFRKIAQRNPEFDSLSSMEVCENDEFEMSMDENMNIKIKHAVKSFKDRGLLLGAYAILKSKSGAISIEWADIKTYYREFKKDGKIVETPWTTYTSEMIKKVAETHAIKKMNNISGVIGEEEFESMKYKNVISIDKNDDINNNEFEEITSSLRDITNEADLNSYYDDVKDKYDKVVFNKLIIAKRNELKNIQQ